MHTKKQLRKNHITKAPKKAIVMRKKLERKFFNKRTTVFLSTHCVRESLKTDLSYNFASGNIYDSGRELTYDFFLNFTFSLFSFDKFCC